MGNIVAAAFALPSSRTGGLLSALPWNAGTLAGRGCLYLSSGGLDPWILSLEAILGAALAAYMLRPGAAAL